MRATILILMIILISVSASALTSSSINITNPTMGGEYGGVLPLRWKIDDKFRSCYYQVDSGAHKTGITRPDLQFINSISKNRNSSWHMDGLRKLDVQNNHLFIAGTDTFINFDVTNPRNITFIKSGTGVGYNDGHTPAKVECFTNRCYISWIDSLFVEVWDINNPNKRQDYMTDYDVPSYVYDIFADDDNTVVAAMPLIDSVYSYDMVDADIGVLAENGHYSGSGAPYYLNGVRAVSGSAYSWLYASQLDNAVGSMDSDLAPIHFNSVIEGAGYNMSSPYDVYYDPAAKIGYAVSNDNSMIHIFNVSTFQTLSYISQYTDDFLYYPERLFVYDNVLYVDDVNNTQIILYDVSDPRYPNFIEKAYTTNNSVGAAQIDSLTDFKVDSDLFFAVNNYYDEVDIYSTKTGRTALVSNLTNGAHNLSITCTGLANEVVDSVVYFTVVTNDSDNDFIEDRFDNCPLVYNPSQADEDFNSSAFRTFWTNELGYTMADLDALLNTQDLTIWSTAQGSGYGLSDGGDACDNCRHTFNLESSGLGDSAFYYQPDLDGDGVGDTCDNCLVIENPYQEDADSDGRGNVCDNCGQIPNYNQSDCNNNHVGDVCDFCSCSNGNLTIMPDGYPQCYSGNCSDNHLDPQNGEISIDYGGACGTCTDKIIQSNIGATSRARLLSPETSIDLGGRCGFCNDTSINGEEVSLNYGGHCGTCEDKIKSPLLNESEADYGGVCGFCAPNSTKARDAVWYAIADKKFPFDESQCGNGQGALFFLALFVIALGVVIFVFFGGAVLAIISFIVSSSIIFGVGVYNAVRFFFKNRQKKEKF